MKTNSMTATLAPHQTNPKSPSEGSPGIPACQPPRKRFVPRTETVIMLMYSAIWIRAKRIDEYSVWKPATSSASPSGRSKGMRATSAVAAQK